MGPICWVRISLAVRLPAKIVEQLDLREGDEVSMDFEKDAGKGKWRAALTKLNALPKIVPVDYKSDVKTCLMMNECFFDTNILIYAVSRQEEKADVPGADRARRNDKRSGAGSRQ